METAAILNLIIWGLHSGPALGAAAQGWSEAAASILINSLWQGAVVASGLALCLRLAPRISARLRYGIWAAGFAAVVSLPFMPALFQRISRSPFATSPADSFDLTAGPTLHSLPSHPLFAIDARWSLAIAAIWLAASLVRAASLVVHALRMRRLWNAANPITVPGLDPSLLTAAATVDPPMKHYYLGAPSFRRSWAKGWDAMSLFLGRIREPLRTPSELCATSDLDRPCVIGFFRPRILIPAWLLARLTPAELDQVILHESEHLLRKDDWANLVQKLCLVAFPLNPALWWLERRLCAEREMACDDGVISRTQAPRAYAACLAGLAERGLEHRSGHREAALSLGVWQRRPELAERVHRLLRRAPVLNPATAAAAVSLFGCGLLAGTVALAHSPQLVAFVAPAQPASNAPTPSAQSLHASLPGDVNGDVNADFTQRSIAFARSSPQPWRAVKTMAILPPARAASLPHNGNSAPRTTSPSQPQQSNKSNSSNHSLASLVPNAVAAQMNAQQASNPGTPQSIQTTATQATATQAGLPEPTATQTSYLVLTTFEEVQSTGPDAAVQGDSLAGETTTNPAAQGAHTSTSVTITRLVFRLNQPAQPASNKPTTSNAKPASNASPASNSTQPIAIPYRDGWLVIQL